MVIKNTMTCYYLYALIDKIPILFLIIVLLKCDNNKLALINAQLSHPLDAYNVIIEHPFHHSIFMPLNFQLIYYFWLRLRLITVLNFNLIDFNY